MEPLSEVLHQVPRIVARFRRKKGRIYVDSEHLSHFELGVISVCPAATSQIVFFTDDEAFAGEPEDYENDMSLICRISPTRGEVWEQYWESGGDFRLFACGVTAAGDTFVAKSTLCEALELYIKLTSDGRRDTLLAIREFACAGRLRTRSGKNAVETPKGEAQPTREYVGEESQARYGATCEGRSFSEGCRIGGREGQALTCARIRVAVRERVRPGHSCNLSTGGLGRSRALPCAYSE